MTGTQERTLGILLGVGMKRGTVTYSALAERIGLNLGWANHRAELGVILGELATYTSAEWGILIPAIAVGKGDNMPSGRTDPANPSGFYAWCAHHGIDISNPYKLVIDEQRKVYNLLAP